MFDQFLLPPLKPIAMKERVSQVFIERGEIAVLDGSFVVVDAAGVRTHIPVGSIACIMLEPGTRVSHRAAALAAGVGTLLVWVGEAGVRLSASGPPVRGRRSADRGATSAPIDSASPPRPGDEPGGRVARTEAGGRCVLRTNPGTATVANVATGRAGASAGMWATRRKVAGLYAAMAGILRPTASDGRYRRVRRLGQNEPETMCRADLGYRSQPTTGRGFATLSPSTPQPDLLPSAAACRASSPLLSAALTAFRGTRARLEAPPAIVSTATAQPDMSTGTFGNSATVLVAPTRVR